MIKLESSFIKYYLVLIPLGLYLVLLPALQTQANGIEGLYNTKRALQLALFLYLILLIPFIYENGLNVGKLIQQLPSYTKLGLILICCLGFLSSLFAPFTEWALLEVSSIVTIFLLTFFVASVFKMDMVLSTKVIKIIVLLVVSLYLLKVFVGYLMHIVIDYPLWGAERDYIGLTGFANKRHFNHIQTWTFPFLYFLIWNQKKSLIKTVLLIITGFWGMLVIVSAARGTFVSILFSLTIILLLFPSIRKEFFKYFLLSVFLAGLFYLIFYILIVDFKSFSLIEKLSNRDSGGRIEEWISLLPTIIDNPIFGTGPMYYSSIKFENNWGHPHNWILQFIYEWGIPVGIIVISLSTTAINSFYQKVRNDLLVENDKVNSNIGIALFWSILASLIHALMSGNLITPLSQVWFILIVGMALASYLSASSSDQNGQADKKLIFILILISLLGYVSWFSKHGFDSDNHSNCYIELYETDYFHPRFWQQGKIGFDE